MYGSEKWVMQIVSERSSEKYFELFLVQSDRLSMLGHYVADVIM